MIRLNFNAVHAIHFRVRPVVSDDDRSYFDDIKENISEGGSPINFDQAKAAVNTTV
jgi:hypothetical protein